MSSWQSNRNYSTGCNHLEPYPCPCPFPKPCPKPYPPIPGPIGPMKSADSAEAFTVGFGQNTLITPSTNQTLIFSTVAPAQGTAIIPGQLQFNLTQPGRYLVLFKGLLTTAANIPATVRTVTTSIVANGVVEDSITNTFTSVEAEQDALTLQALVCVGRTGNVPVGVASNATGISATNAISYRDIRLIIIRLSNIPCTN